VRDLSQIVHNIDGSFDPSGKLIGVEPRSQAEFDARDINNLNNLAQSQTNIYAQNNIDYDVLPQVPQQNITVTYTSTADVYNQGNTIPQIFLKYEEYGVTFDENSINGGPGNVYYQEQLVKSLIDEAPNGDVFSLTSSDGGNIKVRVVYDVNGKLAGTEIVKDGI